MKMRKIAFTKMHGAGNDYIYVDATRYELSDPSEAAIRWSDRHKGIGSDGLVLISRSPVPEADFMMRIFNADGSEAMMCGNASRCVGKYLYERGLTRKDEIKLLTLSGVKSLFLQVNLKDKVEQVTVDMLEPTLERGEWFRPTADLVRGTFVSMGNPHYVVFTDDVDDVLRLGEALERHPAFPHRCNIEFAQIVDKGQIRVRVWERGSGETLACGTGACATAVAAVLNGYTDNKVELQLRGGNLLIEYDRDAEEVYMTGPATTVFEGEIDLPENWEDDTIRIYHPKR